MGIQKGGQEAGEAIYGIRVGVKCQGFTKVNTALCKCENLYNLFFCSLGVP